MSRAPASRGGRSRAAEEGGTEQRTYLGRRRVVAAGSKQLGPPDHGLARAWRGTSPGSGRLGVEGAAQGVGIRRVAGRWRQGRGRRAPTPMAAAGTSSSVSLSFIFPIPPPYPSVLLPLAPIFPARALLPARAPALRKSVNPAARPPPRRLARLRAASSPPPFPA
jgi:hypothetical protein